MTDESRTTGVNMNLGKYMIVLFLGVLTTLLLTVYMVLENQKLRKELKESKTTEYSQGLEKEMRSIYLILAQQSSQVRLIMNTTLTKDHWSKHADNVPQMDCPECMRIYQGIAEQSKELEDMGLPKVTFRKSLKSIGYEDTLESKEVDTK